MKNARQHKQQQAAAAAANAAHGTLLEVPTELERSNSSVSTTKITEIIFVSEKRLILCEILCEY